MAIDPESVQEYLVEDGSGPLGAYGKGLTPIEQEMMTRIIRNEIREKCHFFITFQLTEEQRIVFILREFFHRSYEDIAEILDLKLSTIKARLFRARENLKRHF